MKKIVNIMLAFLVLFLFTLSINVYAAPLPSVEVTTNKDTVHPNEEITVTVNFNQDLGAYTVDVAYDNQLLEYVSAEGGTPNDNGTRVRVLFYDDTGGTNPRTSMSVTFRAKQDIVTSNPTNFSITAEGLSNADASVSYDDIAVPIVKDITIEPVYEDYKIELNYSGNVIQNEEKEMKLVISSAMGKNYAHTRILGEATTPDGQTAKLLATDNQSLEHDIIQSGWGDASGDPIGGKDVVKELDARGLFSGAGQYTITLKLVDRDNSDTVIAEQSFQIQVLETAAVTPPEEVPPTTEENEPITPPETNLPETEETPTTLPKTGHSIYMTMLPVVAVLSIAYIMLRKKRAE